jgi:N-acetyl-anhydromuramyl-L-alanine amidase AmpD
MIVKRGNRGDAVKAIQEKLELRVDGIFGSQTKAAVKNFQLSKGLQADGIVGSATAAALGIDLDELLTTDIQDRTLTTAEGLLIHKSYLDKDEYKRGPKDKFYVFLHHTAGGHNPYATIRNWNNDDRGRIATQFVVGNTSTRGNAIHDGEVVECFPDEDWAYHLGKNNSALLHPHSIGIEICNYGWLVERGGKFYTYVNRVLPDDQVCDLGFTFRGHRYYHKYTEAQIESVHKLLQEISRRHKQVNLGVGLLEWLATQSPAEAFDFKQEACDGKVRGLLTHTSTRKDKSDCSPQPLLVDMLKSL